MRSDSRNRVNRHEYYPNEGIESSKMKQELADYKEALYAAEERILRLRAEMDNQKKRLEREISSAKEAAAYDFVSGLLPVKDSMEQGLDISYMENGNIKAEELFEGMSSTLKILDNAFKKAGVEELDPIGERFDPDIHEAMSVKQEEGEPPNKVLCVYQKGYMLNDRLIRPARVEVSIS